MRKDLKLLLIGPDHVYTGGTGTMYRTMLDELRALGASVESISTARNRQSDSEDWRTNLQLAWRVFFGTLKNIRHSDVVTFHASLRAAMVFAPFLAIMSRTLRRPFILRLFGGAMDQEYHDSNALVRAWFRLGCRFTNMMLVETQMLLDFATRTLPTAIIHFSNYTKIIDLSDGVEPSRCHRFIFAGRVVPEKGIMEIIAAARHVKSGLEIDIYGPIDPCLNSSLAPESLPANVRYCGDLPFWEVKRLMPSYHAQLLPTYYPGEGYPSAVLEGFVAGLPVIGTYWRALPEIVTNDCGILVPPRDSVALATAMNLLSDNSSLYSRLRRGACAQASQFSSRELVGQFGELCESVARRSRV